MVVAPVVVIGNEHAPPALLEVTLATNEEDLVSSFLEEGSVDLLRNITLFLGYGTGLFLATILAVTVPSFIIPKLRSFEHEVPIEVTNYPPPVGRPEVASVATCVMFGYPPRLIGMEDS